MSARSPLICSAVELWYKKMLKIGSLSELTGIDTKIKVAGFQRLYSKWLWLLMAVYKPLFADAGSVGHDIQTVFRHCHTWVFATAFPFVFLHIIFVRVHDGGLPAFHVDTVFGFC